MTCLSKYQHCIIIDVWIITFLKSIAFCRQRFSACMKLAKIKNCQLLVCVASTPVQLIWQKMEWEYVMERMQTILISTKQSQIQF